MTKRIGVLGFLHESNTFLSIPTHYDAFIDASLTRGSALLSRWRGAHHELGGMLCGLEESGFEPIPCMATFAIPSGTIAADCYERIASELIDAVRNALPLDGLLVALHGATVSEQYPDADGEILRRIRDLVGPDLPVFVTLDLHANISEAMVSLSDAIFVYRSNPHLDQFDRGREAALLLVRALVGGIRPVQAFEAPPLIISISKQHTAIEPARGLYDDLNQVLLWPGILSASIAMGFYYADVAEMGASFLAVADGNYNLARRAARWMAARAWERRTDFQSQLPGPEQAVRLASESMKRPVVLMDIGDNVGAGSPADSTILLEEILKQGVRNAMVILYDPDGVARCIRAGVRSGIELDVGAKTDSFHGRPVSVRGRVRTLSDGIFVETQIRHGGWGGGDQGITAVIETEASHTIVLTSRRMAPMSLEQVLGLGIHPEHKDILVVKGVVAPRAAYEPLAGEIILVNTDGVTSDSPSHFQYRRRRRPMFPLEMEANYQTEAAGS